MYSRRVWVSLFVSGLLVLLLVCNSAVNAVSENISMSDIQAMIQIVSPLDNASYRGDVSLNVNVTFQTDSQTNSTVIPVQDIACTYSLDTGEWNNASLNYVSAPNVFWDWINQLYVIQTNASYDATLQSLSAGLHSVTVNLKPGAIHAFDSRTYVDNNGFEYYYSNSPVKFYVTGNLQTAPTSKFPIQGSIAVLAAVLTGIIISAVAIALRKRLRSPKMSPSPGGPRDSCKNNQREGNGSFKPRNGML